MKVSTVIPVYNEAARLSKTLQAIKAFLNQPAQYERKFLFVNDGSVDDTDLILRQFIKENPSIDYIHYSKNLPSPQNEA